MSGPAPGIAGSRSRERGGRSPAPSPAGRTPCSCSSSASGFYLWFPRKWTWQHVRAVMLFSGKLRGKARDFNWHNVIGFWSPCAALHRRADGDADFVPLGERAGLSRWWARSRRSRAGGGGGGRRRRGAAPRAGAALAQRAKRTQVRRAERSRYDARGPLPRAHRAGWRTINVRLPEFGSRARGVRHRQRRRRSAAAPIDVDTRSRDGRGRRRYEAFARSEPRPAAS